MRNFLHTKYAILIIICLIVTNGCVLNKLTSDSEHCYDVESFKQSFNNMANLSVISLTNELESNTKNLSEIKTILGEPIEEWMDTFEYGLYVNTRCDDFYPESYYPYFPDTLWRVPLLIIHKCVWGKDNKDITLFFANDCNNGEQPFWGYVTEYDYDYYIPLRLLPEKDFSLDQVINKRGKPIYESVYTVTYGVDFSMFRNIYALRDVPEATIHLYKWYIDYYHSLVLAYLEDEDKDKSKPICGMLCNNMYFDYE